MGNGASVTINWTLVALVGAIAVQLITAIINANRKIDAPLSIRAEMKAEIATLRAERTATTTKIESDLATLTSASNNRWDLYELARANRKEIFEAFQKTVLAEMDRLHKKASEHGSTQTELLGRIELELRLSQGEHKRLDDRITELKRTVVTLGHLVDRRVAFQNRVDGERRKQRMDEKDDV